MNVYQRIILALSAIAFAVVLLTAPKYVVFQGVFRGQQFEYDPKSEIHKAFHAKRDLSTAAIRAVAVIGATALLYFALGSKSPIALKLKLPKLAHNIRNTLNVARHWSMRLGSYLHSRQGTRTEEKAAKSVRVSRNTYKKIRAVVDAAKENPEKYGDLKKKMDATGNVSKSYKELKKMRAQKARTIRKIHLQLQRIFQRLGRLAALLCSLIIAIISAIVSNMEKNKSADPDMTKLCPYCGKSISVYAKRCTYCGRNLSAIPL